MSQAVSEQALKEAFDLHDHTGGKKISSAELGNALRSVGKRLTNESVKKLTQKADTELKGSLTFDDFKNYVKLATEVEKTDDDIKQAFLVFDNGSGKGVVNVKELKRALTSLGDKLTDQEINSLLKEVGFDERQHDTIDYPTFMKLIAIPK